MYRITTDNGRVGHIAGVIKDTNDGRVVTTVCGKTHPEYEFHVDDTLDACGACDKKFYNIIDDVADTFATEKEAISASKALAKVAVEAEISEPTTNVVVAAEDTPSK